MQPMYIIYSGGWPADKVIDTPSWHRTETKGQWVKKFAYFPVEVKGEKLWLKHYYQRTNKVTDYAGFDPYTFEEVETATLFDILKES